MFGSKAVGLGQAVAGRAPVPPGVALSGAIVEAVAAGGRGTRVKKVDEGGAGRSAARSPSARPPWTRTAPTRASRAST